MPEFRVTLSGLLAPGALTAWSKEKQKEINARIKSGMIAARPATDRIMKEETTRAFDFSKKNTGKLKSSWRINVYATPKAGAGDPVMVVKNLAKWFAIHTTGGAISTRLAKRSMLIPINTYLDSRMSTKKFYDLIAWLQREKLTIILKGILYVKPPMNTSRRGGVGIGTRVQKSFRTKFQGHNKRPTGFGIKLNEHGLTPIAIIRTRIQMKRRMNLQDITTRRLLPVVAASIQGELDKPSRT